MYAVLYLLVTGQKHISVVCSEMTEGWKVDRNHKSIRKLPFLRSEMKKLARYSTSTGFSWRAKSCRKRMTPSSVHNVCLLLNCRIKKAHCKRQGYWGQGCVSVLNARAIRRRTTCRHNANQCSIANKPTLHSPKVFAALCHFDQACGRHGYRPDWGKISDASEAWETEGSS